MGLLPLLEKEPEQGMVTEQEVESMVLPQQAQARDDSGSLRPLEGGGRGHSRHAQVVQPRVAVAHSSPQTLANAEAGIRSVAEGPARSALRTLAHARGRATALQPAPRPRPRAAERLPLHLAANSPRLAASANESDDVDHTPGSHPSGTHHAVVFGLRLVEQRAKRHYR